MPKYKITLLLGILCKKYCGIFENVGSKGQMFLKTKNNKIIEFSSGTFVPKFMIDKYVTCN